MNNPTTTGSLEFRRRAIYTALRSFMNDEQRLQALCIWQEHFAAGPMYALHNYISLVCENSDMQHLRSEMHRSLVRTLSLVNAELDEDPQAQMQEYCRIQKNRKLALSERRPQDRVFEELLNTFLNNLQKLGNDEAVRTRIHLREQVARMPRTPGMTDLEDWLLFRRTDTGQQLETGQMREILHIAYVFACELCGPVETDRALAEAKNSVERLAESAEFAPAKLF